MFLIEEVSDLVVEFTKSQLVISPWLAYINQGVDFLEEIFDLLYYAAEDFALARWTEEDTVSTFGTLPVPARLPQTAFYETATSTAVYLAYNETGRAIVTESSAREALRLLEMFIEEHGYDQFLKLYACITAFENYLAIEYYGEMRESDFVHGKLHRPWIGYTLSDELIYMLAAGAAEIVIHDGIRYVRMKEAAKQHLLVMKRVLQDTGYVEERVKLLRISHFSEMGDYDTVIAHIGPETKQLRAQLFDLCTIEPGLRVLELGSGSGSFTFETGLAEAIGPQGEIICVEPAQGMLRQAKERARETPWVSIIQGVAEDLPFEENSFDIVVGMLFLHLTDIRRTLDEVRRVLKPGGLFLSMHPIQFREDVPFLAEWFSPIAKVSGLRPEETSLPVHDEVPELARARFAHVDVIDFQTPSNYDDADKVVRFYVESVGIFNEALMGLPWTVRQKLIDELRENGKRITARLTPEELVVYRPGQIVAARA